MIKYIKTLDLSEYTLIIPSVSVGNVAQLAVELLLNSLKLSKAAYIWHPNIIPVAVKNDDSTGINTACELYVSEELKVAVIQIRSTYGPFVEVSDLFKQLYLGVKRVVIVTGSFAYQRRDVDEIQQPLRYIASPNAAAVGQLTVPSSWQAVDARSVAVDGHVKIPGSGIADHLFNQCLEDSVPVVMLIEFVSEGDNRLDAHLMANYIDELLQLREKGQLNTKKWKTPAVWDSLFGDTYPMEIF